MKKLLFLALCLLSISGFAQVKSAELTAGGLTCSMCSKAIFKAITAIDFVDSVSVDLEKSTYLITFKNDQPILWYQLKDAVEKAGFFVAKLNVTALLEPGVDFSQPVTVQGSTFRFIKADNATPVGYITFYLVDKGFLPAKEFKRNAKYIETATAEKGLYHAIF